MADKSLWCWDESWKITEPRKGSDLGIRIDRSFPKDGKATEKRLVRLKGKGFGGRQGDNTHKPTISSWTLSKGGQKLSMTGIQIQSESLRRLYMRLLSPGIQAHIEEQTSFLTATRLENRCVEPRKQGATGAVLITWQGSLHEALCCIIGGDSASPEYFAQLRKEQAAIRAWVQISPTRLKGVKYGSTELSALQLHSKARNPF